MNKDDIIKLAREAGFVEYELDDGTTNAFDVRYERFANLVADAERTAMLERSRTIIVQSEERGAAAERETIAQLFDAIPEFAVPAIRDAGICTFCGFSPKTAAKAIRARTTP